MNRVVNKKTKKKTHHFRNFLFLVIIAFIIYYSYKYKVFEKLKNITEVVNKNRICRKYFFFRTYY